MPGENKHHLSKTISPGCFSFSRFMTTGWVQTSTVKCVFLTRRILKHVYLKTASAFLLFIKHLLTPPGVVVTNTVRKSAHSSVTCLINQINYESKCCLFIDVRQNECSCIDAFSLGCSPLKLCPLCFGAILLDKMRNRGTVIHEIVQVRL